MTPEAPETVEAPRKRPGRPKGSKNRPKAETPNLEAETSALVAGLFELVALVTRKPYWRVTPEEAQLVGQPLGRILSRYLDPERMARYSDTAQLVTAAAVVIGPRLALSWSERKEGRRESAQQPSGPVKNPGPENGRQPSGPAAGNGAAGVKDVLPAIVG